MRKGRAKRSFASGWSATLSLGIALVGWTAVCVAAHAAAEDADARARRIVAQMTLDEKIQELHGIKETDQYRTVPGVPRLGIPALNITNGPAGAANGGPGHDGRATALPAPISLAATWDIGAARRYGVVAGKESAFLANGLLEAPTVNIARIPQNGRTFEGYGEDPYLAGRLAVANIEGIQSQGVIANIKHYAGNNQEAQRFTINDDIDERTLREIYLPAFEMGIKEACAGSLMGAYPKVNGAFCCENEVLLNQILKKEWRFDGFVTSDFGAVHSTGPTANAGLDLEMPTGKYWGDDLKAAVTSGAVPVAAIDDKLVRRFRTMMRFGVFDHPPTNRPLPAWEDGAVARRLGEEGMVLLKNDGAALPLDASRLRSIAVIGPFAMKAVAGGGGSSQVKPLYTVDPVKGIQDRVGAKVTVSFLGATVPAAPPPAAGSAAARRRREPPTTTDIAQAVRLAKAADAAIVMVGDYETEGRDHLLTLSGNQDELVAAVAAANPRTIVVLKSGSAVLMPWAETVPAILEAWYPGEEDGNAVADILFGDFNPSGKLPLTFPRRLEDLAASTPAQYPGVNGTAHYSEGVFVGYRHYDAKNIAPLFPFGHGLSYTTFAYSGLKVTPAGGNGATVEFDVANTGKRAGAEVAQVYVGMPASESVPQPPQQLKGFQRMELAPGKKAHIRLALNDRAFSYWDVTRHGWKVAPGAYQVFVGASSRDIRLKAPLSLGGVGVAASNALVPASNANLYVSPTGDDANPGTKERPLRTLEAARDRVRTMNRAMTGDITVTLAGGTYRLTRPLTFGPQDSGAGGHDVIYAAAPGETVTLSGGARVTGWKQIDPARNLWSAPAPEGLTNTRQLYVDGVRAQRTRGRLPVTLTETPTGYTADMDALARWRNPGDIEFVYTGGNALWSEGSFGLGPWTEPRIPVARIQGTTITMAQPCWDNSTKRVMLPPESGFKRTANLVGPASVGKRPEYVENAYELLGTPGQWYFDRAARTFYYVPRPGEDLAKADVEAPVLEKLIDGAGTKDDPVHNLVFRGLRFAYATWLLPSTNEGFSEIQANYMVTGPDGYATQGLGDLAPGGKHPFGAWTRTPGNVTFAHDRAVRFLEDAFVHLGGAGLELGHGTQNAVVRGCILTDISANGLELGGVDLPDATGADITRDNEIANNHIYNVAAEYHGGVGIDVGYAQRTQIRHNQLDHLPYSGISMGWGGWPDKIKKAGVANFSQNNVVEGNLIFDHLLLLADGGGIYTQGLTGPSLADGEKIIGNVVRDQIGSGHGIYTDNGCKNVTMRGNVMLHINMDNWGSRHKDYYDGKDGSDSDAFLGEDNWWQQGDPDSTKGSVTLKGNHLISALDQVPAAVLANAGLEPAYRHLLEERLTEGTCAPEPPSRVAVAMVGGGAALVTWNPLPFEGSSPLRSFTVAASNGATATISAADFRTNGYVKVTGLTGDAPIAFTVTASNADGTSAPSLPSAPLTPEAGAAAPLAAPTVGAIRISADGRRASIHFQAPAGKEPVVAYVLTANPGGRKTVLTGRAPLTLSGAHSTFGVIDGLTPGQTYTFSVAALGAAGEGAVATSQPMALIPQPLRSQANQGE